MNFGKSQFEIAQSSTKDEFLLDQGIEDASLAKSLGIFTIFIVLLALVTLVYFITKRCGGCCAKLRNWIAGKIFYKLPIRYVIVGYLKIFN